MSENKPDKTLDCIGLFCPQPLFQTRHELDEIEDGGVLEVLADDPAAEEDIKRLVKRTGHEVLSIEKKEDHIRYLIKKHDRRP